jgi:hypothetical protein
MCACVILIRIISMTRVMTTRPKRPDPKDAEIARLRSQIVRFRADLGALVANQEGVDPQSKHPSKRRAPSRDGMISMTFWMEPAIRKWLRQTALNENTTIQRLFERAVLLLSRDGIQYISVDALDMLAGIAEAEDKDVRDLADEAAALLAQRYGRRWPLPRS